MIHMLFETKPKPRKIIPLAALDALLLLILGVAFLLLDFGLRDVLKPESLADLRIFMIASWIIVFILEVTIRYVSRWLD
jgi:hypothetical protein